LKIVTEKVMVQLHFEIPWEKFAQTAGGKTGRSADALFEPDGKRALSSLQASADSSRDRPFGVFLTERYDVAYN
jgi:hypothetical protein